MLSEWDEASPYKDIANLEPDYERYFQLEKAGMLRTIIAMKGDNIAGFAVFIVYRNLHCNLIGVSSDTFYVLPEFRKSGIGIGLFKKSIDMAKEEKANYLLSHAPNERIGKLYKFLGFSSQETTWIKRI